MSLSKTRRSADADRALKKLLADYRGKRGSLIPLLQKTQELYGYLPERALTRIAKSLKLSTSQVCGVATFYTQFRLTPMGDHLIKVCHGTACHVSGAEKISELLELALGIKTNETTADGRFTLEDVACLGCCSLSPVIMIDKKVQGKLTPRNIPAILKRYP